MSINRRPESVPIAAIYENLAEEAAELAQAALKYARILRQENPTPVDPAIAFGKIQEEYSDVVLLTRVLRIYTDEKQMSEKMDRWVNRLNDGIRTI